MNEFDKNNENTTPQGEIHGFDSVNGEVQDGFYTKSGDDIIQDDIKYEAPQNNYSSYSYSNSNSYGYGNYYTPKKTKKQHSTAVVVACAILAAIIGATGAIAAMFAVDYGTQDAITEQKQEISNVNISVDETAQSIAEAVAIKASDSVVGIRTTTSVTSFFGGTSDATGEGSGVIYKEDGYIITNYHVIEEAVQSNNSKIEVFVGSKDTESHLAQVIGYNISTDLAVIKIDAKNLKAAEIGSSKDLSVGQYVITIGAPGGLEFMGSVTYGIISGLDRVVSANTGLKLIQTDAAINPGNSGGALLNAKGQLIGINSSKIVAEEFEGMGFAIPIATVVEKCDKIIARKDEPAPYVGISISERYTREVLSFYGYPAGAVVSGVIEGSPADLAGIRRGDIITELNGTAISEYTVFGDVLHDLEPNQKVSIKIYRSGRTYDATITIGSDSAQ
ncbi:MAG: trypsin-like peptidase domain-containing protein [Acutalibacteraceae bacterium]|nr:trypsin-like peptidase domain-containing protein [Acutalibacteraceae bacterium]